MPNTELLTKTLDYIKTHPDEWDQSDYAKRTDCGTSYCFAGWAVQLSGIPITIDPDGWARVVATDLPERIGNEIAATYRVDVFDKDGYATIREVAAVVLDLDDNHSGYDVWTGADKLFSEYNDLGDLERIVAELCGATGEDVPVAVAT